MSKDATRVSPRYHAMPRRFRAASAPRSYRIHWPSPCADQRVARLLSSVFCGTLPSFALATTDAAGSGARSAPMTGCVVVRWGRLGSVRWLVHARERTAVAASAAFYRGSRWARLYLKFILGLLPTCF